MLLKGNARVQNGNIRHCQKGGGGIVNEIIHYELLNFVVFMCYSYHTLLQKSEMFTNCRLSKL
jgi:hypothetical protein